MSFEQHTAFWERLMFLAVPVLMALIVQVLLNMLLHVQESAFPVWLTASYIMVVRFP